jgi:drug/metabolite transporter (DMT)-like permease
LTRKQLLADSSLILVVLVWGATFVMVQDAVREWPVFAFLALRFTIASVAFVPVLLWKKTRSPQLVQAQRDARRASNRAILLPAIVIGVALASGYAFQTAGLLYTTPAKAGFITGLSVVMVPLGAAAFLRQPASPPAVVGVILATAGLALLSLNQDLQVGLGDLLVFFCAISFAGQILLMARYAPRSSAFRLAALQILTVAIVTGLISLFTEVPGGLPPLTEKVLFAAVFTGLLATTVAFTLQAAAQRFTSATHTALIFSLEPVFAAIASYLLIGEQFTARILVGGGLILAGMLSAELGSIWLANWRTRQMGNALSLGD